jgi:hypothetical protein
MKPNQYAGTINECSECGNTDVQSYDASASEPQCTECVDGFWEMMGEDPCGKNWEA